MTAAWGWEEAVAAFCGGLEVRHYAPTSVAILRRWLLRFAGFCGGLGVAGPAGVTASGVDAWEAHLRCSPGWDGVYRASTVEQALRALQAFFRWAVRERRVFLDPTRHLVVRRGPRPVPPLYTPEEMVTVLQTPHRGTAEGLRNRAVLETLYATGVRVGECCGLDVDDVDFAGGGLRVRWAKGGRQRLLPLGEHLAEVLADYLRESRPGLAVRPEEPALFLSLRGTRYSRESLRQMVRKTGLRAGVGRLFPHALRHACASHLLAAGAEVEDVARLLGHEKLESTQAYTHTSPRQLRRAYRASHPRA